jgi:hypothetical protein
MQRQRRVTVSAVSRGGVKRAREVAPARKLAMLAIATAIATMAAPGMADPAAWAAADAHSSRSLSLSETGRLHLTSHHGFTLNEQGTASGTISATIYIHLHVVSTNHVTAEVSLYPKGGSLTGLASASYRPSGAVASFAGTMNISRGTGSYSHASGSGLSFSGTIERSNDAVTVRVAGHMSA